MKTDTRFKFYLAIVSYCLVWTVGFVIIGLAWAMGTTAGGFFVTAIVPLLMCAVTWAYIDTWKDYINKHFRDKNNETRY